MKLQLKVFIVFAVVVVVLFSAINFIIIYFLKQEQLRHEKELLSVYSEIIKQNDSYQLPYYITRYGSELSIDEQYGKERFKNFSETILLWEALFILTLSFLFYRVLGAISKKEIEHEEFLKFLFFILSHKIGNFLSMMKVNIEIMKHKPEQRIIERLYSGCTIMADELNSTIETVKRIPRHSKKIEKVNLRESVENALRQFQTEKKIKMTVINTRDLYLQINKEAFEIILFLLLNNAFRYSYSRIHIKVCTKAIAIRNDFSEIVKGSGLGFPIAEYLCRSNKFDLKYRAKNENFLVVFRFE